MMYDLRILQIYIVLISSFAFQSTIAFNISLLDFYKLDLPILKSSFT